jgi:ribokinase
MNPGGAELKRGRKTLLPSFRRLDLLFLNRTEAAQLTGKPAGDLKAIMAGLRRVNALCVLTDGQKGAYAITADRIIHAAIVTAERINVTGAGDAFCSAFAAALLKNKGLETALAVGTLNATEVVQHTGAKVGILRRWPSAREISKVKTKLINL